MTKPNIKNFTVRMPEALIKRIHLQAFNEGTSMQDWVNENLRNLLDEDEAYKPGSTRK